MDYRSCRYRPNMPSGEFDIVVDLEHVNRRLQHREVRESRDVHGTAHIEIGLYDSEEDVEYFREVLPTIIKNIESIERLQSSPRILFKCQAGKSRSVTVALAFLCKQRGLTVEEGLDLIRGQRPIVHPRPSFVSIVQEYLSI